MSESKQTPGELFLEKARLSGIMKWRKKEEFEAIAEMMDSPYSLEQMKAQIKRAEIKREEQIEKFKKQIDSK